MDCQNDGTRREEIDLFDINRYLSPELQYACRYLAHHLVQSSNLENEIEEAFLFLKSHFLHWLK